MPGRYFPLSETAQNGDMSMCEFCKNGKTIKSCNFCGAANARLVGTVLDVYGNKEKFRLFKEIYAPRFIIKHCPMCGRKLSEVSENG